MTRTVKGLLTSKLTQDSVINSSFVIFLAYLQSSFLKIQVTMFLQNINLKATAAGIVYLTKICVVIKSNPSILQQHNSTKLNKANQI